MKTVNIDPKTKADAKRLIVTLKNAANDIKTAKVMAAALGYHEPQMSVDMTAVYAYVQALEEALEEQE